MPTLTDTTERFAGLDPDEKHGPREYNYEHFRAKHLLQDAQRTVQKNGIRPGQMAPDFALPRADGNGTLRLSDFRGRPVLLHFGSLS